MPHAEPVRSALALVALTLLPACGPVPPAPPVVVTVEARWPGASAEQVDQVLLPTLEAPLSGVPGADLRLASAADELGTVWVRFPAGQELAASLAVTEALRPALTALPEQARTPRVFTGPRLPHVEWLPVDAIPQAAHRAQERSDQRVARQERARSLTTGVVQGRWYARPDIVAGSGLPWTQVLRAAEASPTLDAAIVVAPGVRLSDVATPSVEVTGPHAQQGATEVALVAHDGASGAAEGWQPVQGALCVVGWGRGSEQMLPVLVPMGTVLVDTGRLEARLEASAAPPASPGVQIATFPCAAPRVRIALLAKEPSTDLDLARSSLDLWSGSLAVMPTAPAGGAEVRMGLPPAGIDLYGLGPSDVRALLQPVQKGPDRLQWAHPLDVDALSIAPLRLPGGRDVPLSALASLELVFVAPPSPRLDGRRALMLDVVLGPGADLKDWSVPGDVEIVVVDGMGPVGLGLVR